MPGLTFSNELIARDEGLHCDFACMIYGLLERQLDQDIVQSIISEAVEVEKVITIIQRLQFSCFRFNLIFSCSVLNLQGQQVQS
jgi:hypothetical protein